MTNSRHMTDDSISRQAAILQLSHNKCGNDENDIAVQHDIETIRALHSAQLERKTGEWIRNDNGTYSCSVCQSWIPEQQHFYARYCLYCGADMRGEQDETD